VARAVKLLTQSDRDVKMAKGSMLALQVMKSRAVMDFSVLQGAALLAQMDRLLK